MNAGRVIIAGGTGFIGRSLVPHLAAEGYEPIVLSRTGAGSKGRTALWDGATLGTWFRELDGAAAVINLTGSPVDCRHTMPNKRRIVESRVNSVKVLAAAAGLCATPPATWIQASGIGFYGPGERPVDESSAQGTGFLADVCGQWESALRDVPTECRMVVLRIGVVLGRDGSAFKTLSKLVWMGLGGAAGNGRQFVSWVHLDDVVMTLQRLLQGQDARGVFNVTSPEPETNATFMRTLRRILRRPWSPPVPEWAMRIGARFMGTEASLALDGIRVKPRRLLDLGYQFRHPQLEGAIRDGRYRSSPAGGG